MSNVQNVIYKEPVKLLQNLIRFDTTNPPGNEKDCIGYINKILIDAGFETQLLAKDLNRPNLITHLKGAGKTNPILLYGHVDVVTTENQIWKYPPFEAKIAEDEPLYSIDYFHNSDNPQPYIHCHIRLKPQ